MGGNFQSSWARQEATPGERESTSVPVIPFQGVGKALMGRWCSGILSGLLGRRSGVQFPDPPTLEKWAQKWAKGICLCNLLQSTQPNDRETVIKG